MLCNNLAIITAAGSGKTTYIADEVSKRLGDNYILLLTYTSLIQINLKII